MEKRCEYSSKKGSPVLATRSTAKRRHLTSSSASKVGGESSLPFNWNAEVSTPFLVFSAHLANLSKMPTPSVNRYHPSTRRVRYGANAQPRRRTICKPTRQRANPARCDVRTVFEVLSRGEEFVVDVCCRKSSKQTNPP